MSEDVIKTANSETSASSWLAQTVRVTGFATAGSELLPSSWKEVTGSEPDQTVKRPGFLCYESGVFGDKLRLTISYQPGRMDIVLQPDPPNEPPTELLNIGEPEAVIDSVISVAENAFKPDAAIQRIAIGAVLIQPVASFREGLRLLKTIQPMLQGVPEEATDILFRYNLRTQITTPVPNVWINNLRTWQIAEVQLLNVAATPGMAPHVTTSVDRRLLTLEFDINTSPEITISPLPRAKLPALLNELAKVIKSELRQGEPHA